MAKGTHSYDLDKSSIYKWISWGARRWPVPIANFTSDMIADRLYARAQSKIIVEEQVKNLDAILGPAVPAAEKRRIVRKLWRRHGRFLLDMFRFEGMTGAEIKSRVSEFKGLENIHSALKKGRGAVILTAHLGHWELGGILLDYLGFKVNIIQQLYESKEQNEILDKNKAIRGIKVIASADPAAFALSVHRALRNNELVAIQGDRDLDKSGVKVNFFGRPASFPRGPVMLALKTGAALVPAFTLMGGDGMYHPVAEPEIELEKTGDTERDLHANIQKVAAVIEKYVRRHPEQWFNFYYFWE